jgi:hypothetical protein
MRGYIHEMAIVRSRRRSDANTWSWRDVLLWSVMAAVPAALALLAFYAADRRSHPTDDELTERFISHEADFEALSPMLDSDCRRLPIEAKSCELIDLEGAGVGAARVADYRLILARVGAPSFSYDPRSGNLSLPVSKAGDHAGDSGKSYLYLAHEASQPLLHQPSYALRGPGIYRLTGDHRIKGRWFIHHDGTVVVAFSPY